MLKKAYFSLTSLFALVKIPSDIKEYSKTFLWRTEMQEYEDLKTMVAEIEADIRKAEGGNKAAGTRVRKQMQQVKQAAQVVRNKVLEMRSAD